MSGRPAHTATATAFARSTAPSSFTPGSSTYPCRWYSAMLRWLVAPVDRTMRPHPSPADGRGCLLVLTPAGWDVLRDAAPSHVASVRRHFVDRLTSDELAALGRIARKLSTEG